MTDDEIIAVVQAHREGKSIQFKPHWDKWWMDVVEPPIWEFSKGDYRVAPESRRPREWELFSPTDELKRLAPHLCIASSCDGKKTEFFSGDTIRVREVIE